MAGLKEQQEQRKKMMGGVNMRNALGLSEKPKSKSKSKKSLKLALRSSSGKKAKKYDWGKPNK